MNPESDRRERREADESKPSTCVFNPLTIALCFVTGIFSILLVVVFVFLFQTRAQVSQVQTHTREMKQELKLAKKDLSESVSEVSDRLKKETSSWNQRLNASNRIERPIDEVFPLIGWRNESDGLIYKLFTEAATRETSQTRCEGFGGRILTQGLRNESVFRDLVNAKVILSSPESWVGYDDLQQEGTWKWLDGGQTNPTVVQWNRGEPDNFQGLEDCAQIIDIVDSRAIINDLPCGSTRSYVCEVSLTKIPYI